MLVGVWEKPGAISELELRIAGLVAALGALDAREARWGSREAVAYALEEARWLLSGDRP